MLSFDEDAKHQLPHLDEVHFNKAIVFEINPQFFEAVSLFASHTLLQAVGNNIILLRVWEKEVEERFLGRPGIVPSDSSHLDWNDPDLARVLDAVLVV